MSNKNVPSLPTLPIELLYRVFAHLDDFTIFCSIQHVCERINRMLNVYRPYQVIFFLLHVDLFLSVSEYYLLLLITNFIQSTKDNSITTVYQEYLSF